MITKIVVAVVVALVGMVALRFFSERQLREKAKLKAAKKRDQKAKQIDRKK